MCTYVFANVDINQGDFDIYIYIYIYIYGPADFNCLHLKSESVWCLSFQEERLNMNWNGNLDSSVSKNTRLVIWRSEVRILVQVQIFLLKSKE